jgi:hypothetical protein
VRKEQLIVLCRHQALHADHNQDDCLFIQLTRREIWLVLYGLLWASGIEPRLEQGSEDLLEKISELLDVQRPEWRRGSGEETA